MRKMFQICKWDRFNDVIENRVDKINYESFTTLLNNTYNNFFIYKKIYEPDFSFGYYKKCNKTPIDRYTESFYIKEKINISYPEKKCSLVCSTNDIDEELGTTFLVFPFKESLFTIKENENYYKGYWKDKIKWLEKFNNHTIWTEDDCILIKKSIWNRIKKKYLKNETFNVI